MSFDAKAEALKVAVPHVYVDDCWYSCPLAENGCCDDRVPKDKCRCGADATNAAIQALAERAYAAGRDAYHDEVNRIGYDPPATFDEGWHGGRTQALEQVVELFTMADRAVWGRTAILVALNTLRSQP